MSFGGLNTVQWSLAPFQTASDGRKCTRQAGLLRQALDQRRVRHWYAPIPAGLKSLIQWDASARWHTSVVRSIAHCFKRPRNVHAWVFFSIRPEHYTHSTTDQRYRAESTRILTRIEKAGYGKCIGANGTIDLPSLIRAQLREEGISCESRDKSCYLAMEGAYHTRLPAPLCDHRNLIMVTHDAD